MKKMVQTFVGGVGWPIKHDDEFVEPAENCNFVFGFNEFDDVGVHAPFTGRRRRHFDV